MSNSFQRGQSLRELKRLKTNAHGNSFIKEVWLKVTVKMLVSLMPACRRQGFVFGDFTITP
jgi:hypothetical protein